MAKTLSELRSEVAKLLRDRNNVHTAAVDLNDAIRDAYREVWHEVYRANADFWQPVTKLYTWTADQLEADLDDILIGPDYRLRMVCVTPRIEALSRTNLPYPLRRKSSEDMYPLARAQEDRNPFATQYSGWLQSVGTLTGTYSWDLRGSLIRLDPVPATNTQLVFYYCEPPGDMFSDNLVPMDPRLRLYERVLVYGAALLATGKDRFSDDGWAQQHAKYMGRILEAVAQWTNDGTAYVSLAGF